MVLDEKTVRRRAIFAFYDREGIVDEYIPHLLREMGPFCDKMLAVVNLSLIHIFLFLKDPACLGWESYVVSH